MRNNYDGWCCDCGLHVPAHIGFRFKGRSDTKWRVYCEDCWPYDDGRYTRYRPERAAQRPFAGCWAVLGISSSSSRAEIDRAYRERAKAAHPDAPGGSHEMMVKINEAVEQARKHVDAMAAAWGAVGRSTRDK